MPAEPATTPYMTYPDFVVFERQSPTKHEWLGGAVFDMSGGTYEHSALKVELVTSFSNQLRGKRCRVLDSDMAVRVLATGLLTYPDVSIVCGNREMDPDNENALTNPRVIVEVLSDSTETYDRGEKFAHYRRIPSLAEYVLLSQHQRGIEVYRESSSGAWDLAEKALAGESVTLKSIECVIVVDDVYADPLAP